MLFDFFNSGCHWSPGPIFYWFLFGHRAPLNGFCVWVCAHFLCLLPKYPRYWCLVSEENENVKAGNCSLLPRRSFCALTSPVPLKFHWFGYEGTQPTGPATSCSLEGRDSQVFFVSSWYYSSARGLQVSLSQTLLLYAGFCLGTGKQVLHQPFPHIMEWSKASLAPSCSQSQKPLILEKLPYWTGARSGG